MPSPVPCRSLPVRLTQRVEAEDPLPLLALLLGEFHQEASKTVEGLPHELVLTPPRISFAALPRLPFHHEENGKDMAVL